MNKLGDWLAGSKQLPKGEVPYPYVLFFHSSNKVVKHWVRAAQYSHESFDLLSEEKKEIGCTKRHSHTQSCLAPNLEQVKIMKQVAKHFEHKVLFFDVDMSDEVHWEGALKTVLEMVPHRIDWEESKKESDRIEREMMSLLVEHTTKYLKKKGYMNEVITMDETPIIVVNVNQKSLNWGRVQLTENKTADELITLIGDSLK